MRDALERGVVAVLNGAGDVVGAGFVVDDGLALTCAHVVDAYIGGNAGGASLSVRFHGSGEVRPAQVVSDGWQPGGEDVALLQLEGEMPAGAVALTLGPSAGREGGAFRVLGYPRLGDMEAVWASGRVEGVAPDGEGRDRLQLSSQNLAQGHSGAPVWDEAAGRVIGMVSEVYLANATGKHRDTAYAIPAETLWRLLPRLAPPPVPAGGEDGPALTPDLLEQVRAALRQCGPFDSDAALRAVFIDARLRPWRDEVPAAPSVARRVDAVVDLLHDKENADGAHALALLLRVLGERAHPGDACHGRLLDLAERVGGGGNPGARTGGQPPRPVENPFFHGGRINDPENFFGRQRLLREIKAELRKGTNVSLVGGTQVGKSSLLYYLRQTREEWLPGVPVAYVDLQGVWDEADFCETVLQKMGERGDDPRRFKQALSGRPLVLLLDEVERMGWQDFDPRWHNLLRSLAQEREFAMCLATQRPLIEVIPAPPGGLSPFHNIFTVKELGPFSKAEARAFLRDRLAGAAVRFTEADVESLLTESGGHPARLQRLARNLFAEYARGERDA